MRALIVLAMLGLLWPAFASVQAAAATHQRVAASDQSGSIEGGPTSDPRRLVKVSEPARLLLLQNMADMMANVASILDGLASNDRNVVVKAATANGMAMLQDLPSSQSRKFPKGFAQMADETHKTFDQIAAEAKTAKSPKPIFKHLSQALQTCVACHAAYRFGSSH